MFVLVAAGVSPAFPSVSQPTRLPLQKILAGRFVSGGSISLVGAIATRSLPRSLAAARRGFTFYLADPCARLTTIALGGSGEPPLPELNAQRPTETQICFLWPRFCGSLLDVVFKITGRPELSRSASQYARAFSGRSLLHDETRTRHPVSQGARELDSKQFGRFVRQAYLIVSRRAWLNGPRKSEKLPALPQPTNQLRKLSRSATLQHSGDPTFSSCWVWR